jgi:hypothetical protein
MPLSYRWEVMSWRSKNLRIDRQCSFARMHLEVKESRVNTSEVTVTFAWITKSNFIVSEPFVGKLLSGYDRHAMNRVLMLRDRAISLLGKCSRSKAKDAGQECELHAVSWVDMRDRKTEDEDSDMATLYMSGDDARWTRILATNGKSKKTQTISVAHTKQGTTYLCRVAFSNRPSL